MDKTMKMVGALLVVVAAISIAVLFSGTPAVQEDTGATATGTIYFFYGEECPHCHNIMPFIVNMTKKYPEVSIQSLEIWHNETNHQIFEEANTAAGLSSLPGVPEVVFGKSVLIGERDIPAKLEGLIQDYLKKKP